MDQTKPKLGSTEETNRLLGGEFFDTKTDAPVDIRKNTDAQNQRLADASPAAFNQFADQAGFSAITSESLKDTKPMEVVSPSPALETAGLQGFIESQSKANQDEFTRNLERETENAKKPADQSFHDLLAGLTGTQGETEQISNLYSKKGGVDDVQKELNDINQQILSEQAGLQRQVELIEKNAGGDFGPAVEDKIAEAKTKSLRKQADLSIIQMGIQGRYDSAKAIADRAVTVQLEKDKNRNEALQFTYERNQDQFTTEEKRAFESAQADRERVFDEKKDVLTKNYDLAIELMKNGAPSSVSQNVMRAESVEKGIQEAGTYLSDKSLGSVVLTPEQSADPFIQSLVNTSGGKALTDTTIQKLDKGLTVLGQLGVLQTNIQDVKTGPITGAFRGVNPWDTNAQTIKAQLNAVVPNLARGIYGEVGVLTDNDIKTYSQTLPNLKSTEEVRNAVLYITLDMIGKSIKNTLSVNAAAHRDVSGFVDIYTEMENTKNSILETIPKDQVPKAFEVMTSNGSIDLTQFEAK